MRAVTLGVLVTVAAALAAAAPGVSAVDSFENGSGKASAQVLRVGPSVASLPAAPTVARALADHSGTVGRGEAQAVDWSALELYLNPDLVAATPPLRVTSTDEGSELGRTATAAAAVVQEASATDAPLGRSVVTVASLSVPGLVEVGGGRAEASSGVVAGPAREARGVVEIPAVRLAGGLVTLTGLRWEAVQRTGPDGSVQLARGTFTAGDLQVGGVPVLSGEATTALLRTVLGVLDTALGPTGLDIRFPEEEVVEGGAVRITPLAIHYEASEATRGLLSPVLDLLDPVRQAVTPTLNDLLKSLGDRESLPIDPQALGLALDVLFGTLAGSASFDVELGGAAAFTEGEVFDDFDLFGNGFVAGAPAPDPVPPPPAGDAAPAALPATDTPRVAGEQVKAPGPPTRPAERASGPFEDAARGLRRSLASAAWAVALGFLLWALAARAGRGGGGSLPVPVAARRHRPPPIT